MTLLESFNLLILTSRLAFFVFWAAAWYFG